MKIKQLFFGCTALLAMASYSNADTITDWNIQSIDLITNSIKAPPPAYRALALVQAGVYSAVNSITQTYPASEPSVDTAEGASVDAAIASASYHLLNKALPKSGDAIAKTYQTALDKIPDNQSRADGIIAGELAANAVLAMRSGDKIGIPETYRPKTEPGVYVPTVTPVASTWSSIRLPWGLKTVDQFRPDEPPALDSEQWAADYNEIKMVGSRNSSVRTSDQTAAAHFWEATSPAVYFPVVRSVALQSGRDITRNARLMAITSQAVDDSLTAVFDAKYHYGFWRPMTAIRNGDTDTNDATDRQADWQPLINTPMHPEYPCAHCIVSGAVGTSLKIDLGDETYPTLSSSSPTTDGASRSWNSIDDFMQEVINARVWEGVHFRNSGDVGSEMGRLVAEQVATNFPSR